MAISVKIAGFLEKASWIRKMFEEGAKLRSIYGDDKVFDFTLGNPTMEPPSAFREVLLKTVENPFPGMHRYMSNAGYEECRSAVAEHLSLTSPRPVEPWHVVMTCGAGGALNVVLKTILNPGEEVLVLAPYFVEYGFYVDNHAGVTKVVQTRPDSFQPDLQALEKAIGPNTRALIINSPNNPTGVVYPAEALAGIGKVLAAKEKQHDRRIYLISDEPYSRLVFDGVHIPPVFAYSSNSVLVTSHSKDLALPGERIGYMAVNPAMEEAEKFMEGAIFCNRVLGFVNAPALMQLVVAQLQEVTIDSVLYQRKRDMLYNHLSGLGFSMVKPQGGFYLFPRSPLADDVEFVHLAQKHRILAVPGSGFGAPGYFRLAYCIDDAVIERSFPAWDALAREAGL